MATKKADKVKDKKKSKADKPVSEPKVKKEKAPKTEAAFTIADVWAVGKEVVSQIRPLVDEFASKASELQKTADADPKTYRDHIVAIKFLNRRADRVGLSLAELEAGMKERKPRVPKAPKAPKAKKEKVAKVEEPDEDEFDEDEDEDEDLN